MIMVVHKSSCDLQPLFPSFEIIDYNNITVLACLLEMHLLHIALLLVNCISQIFAVN